ncbi:TonB-dependent receptor [Fibrella sp. HMF5335]|uniref:TonB-dependent receptor n=1 Tax=Fibrella rubiginis TaxID=2817060 RepID=A0A939K6W0_9BACT|nr:TonB-dependent receptor [Fibrella rubiginis]MBO0939278.1 TonB-dependent receptor [Fibrella rubiginis]
MRCLFLSLWLLPSLLLAQSRITVSGYVRDARTGEALIGATVYAPLQKVGVQANAYGYYSLSLPQTADTIRVQASFIGYTTRVEKLTAQTTQNLTLALTAENQQLNEVMVQATASDDHVQRPQLSAINVSMKQIRTLPMIAGERDVLKVIQFLPGVQSGNEGTTGFFVRGGNIDQNLVLLDEATVYNPNHLFGLFSTFNVNALNSVNLIKGGFPAQYGGRLSSVLDITMREGNRYKFSGEGGIGLISSNLTLEGPLQRGKSSFIVSARRSYLDLLLKPFQSGGNSTNYSLSDLNAKLNYELSKRDHLFVSLFNGQDRAAFTGASSLNYGIGFGNRTATFRWNHLLGQKIFINTSLLYNDYHLSLSTTQGNYYALLYTGIRDWSAKSTLEWYPSPTHQIKAGLQWTEHRFAPSSYSAKVPRKGNSLTLQPDSLRYNYAQESAFFVNDEWRLSDKVAVSVGLRVPVYSAGGTTYARLEPRLTAKYAFSPQLSMKAAYTEMNQFLHLVPNSTASLPTDIWVSSSPVVKPQFSRQVALGLFRSVEGNRYELSLEAYYKTMQNQVLFKQGTQLLFDTNIDTQLTFGRGESYGLEAFVRKNTGRLTGWLAYTLSKTTQTFADLNYGQLFPFTYDRRHVLSVVGTYELSPRWVLSANFVFNSGGAYTLPAGRVPVYSDGSLYDGTYYDYTSRNNTRFRAYNRLDVSAIYRKKRHLWKRAYESEWVFSIYNVYSRLNPYFIYLTTDPTTKQPQARQVSLLPIIPGVSYNFKF